MTPEQYWDGEDYLPKAYREADAIRRKRENEHMWLQGLYIYDALLRASPALKPFVKRPEPMPYMTEPFPLTEEDAHQADLREQKRRMDAMKEQIAAFAAQHNKKFAGGGSDGNRT